MHFLVRTIRREHILTNRRGQNLMDMVTLYRSHFYVLSRSLASAALILQVFSLVSHALNDEKN